MPDSIECKCALSRFDKNMNNFSCFYDHEIKKIYSILQSTRSLPTGGSIREMYDILIEKYKCPANSSRDNCLAERIS